MDYACLFYPHSAMTDDEWSTSLSVARVIGRRAALKEAQVALTQGFWLPLDANAYRWMVRLLLEGGDEAPMGELELPLDDRYAACVESYLDTWGWLLEQPQAKMFQLPLATA